MFLIFWEIGENFTEKFAKKLAWDLNFKKVLKSRNFRMIAKIC
jgi:hypothetical protein